MPEAVYKDTPNNRKLGRVGEKFGDPKFKATKEQIADLKVSYEVFKDNANNRKLNRVGKRINNPKFRVHHIEGKYADTLGNIKLERVREKIGDPKYKVSRKKI